MKNYKEEVKAIRKEWIRSKIKMIEESIRYLKPWDYVECKDGIPRIGRKLVAYLSLENLNVPEIIKYFRNRGFIIEKKDNNSIIYLKDNMSKDDALYKEITENLITYAYAEWPSNWPKSVNDELVLKGIKVYNKSKDIQILSSLLKTRTFERIIGKIQGITELCIFSTDQNIRMGIVNQRTTADKEIEEFFIKQGFDLDPRKTIIIPLENKKQSGIIKYCYEEIYKNIASYLIEEVKKGQIRHAPYVNIQIRSLISEEVENMLISDGFVVEHIHGNALKVSLL